MAKKLIDTAGSASTVSFPGLPRITINTPLTDVDLKQLRKALKDFDPTKRYKLVEAEDSSPSAAPALEEPAPEEPAVEAPGVAEQTEEILTDTPAEDPQPAKKRARRKSTKTENTDGVSS